MIKLNHSLKRLKIIGKPKHPYIGLLALKSAMIMPQQNLNLLADITALLLKQEKKQ